MVINCGRSRFTRQCCSIRDDVRRHDFRHTFRQTGRKTILICVTLFSGFTFIGAFAKGPTEFAILRFIAGLGIGGVMPNVVALMTEYAPKIRSTLVAIMFSGAIGGMTSALLGAGS